MNFVINDNYQSGIFNERYSYISTNIENKISHLVFLEDTIKPIFVLEIHDNYAIIYFTCDLRDLAYYIYMYLVSDYCPPNRKVILKPVNTIKLIFTKED